MDLQPTLENKLVKIRPLLRKDMEPMYEVAKDPKIWEQHHCNRYLRTVFDQFFEESLESNGALTIFDKATGEVIGSSRFKKVEALPTALEIGWTFLGRSFWGGKYNKAVKDLMIAHAFNYVDKVVLYVAKDNIRSQKAVEKMSGQRISPSDFEYLPKESLDNETYVIKRSERR